MKVGTNVKYTPPGIAGAVKDVRWNKDTESLECLVQWSDGDDIHERWFGVEQLEVL